MAVSFLVADDANGESEAHFSLIEARHGMASGALRRETVPGFEPKGIPLQKTDGQTNEPPMGSRSPEQQQQKAQEDEVVVVEGVVPGVRHSALGLAHDRMVGGVKGRRKSKKDKLREAAMMRQRQKEEREAKRGRA